MTGILRLPAAASVVAMALVLVAPSASAGGTFSAIAGSWAGAGKVHLAGGQSEAIKCKAYYIAKAGGAGLSMAIRCAAPSHKIDMRANLETAGNGLTGNWEERQFNAAGTVKGRASEGEIKLNITGGGFEGLMTVKLNGATQDVSISTQGTGFTGVQIQMAKGS
jgi:hypothetical protein